VDVAGVRYELPDGRVLLDDVSFRVGDGQKVALVGANGAGKTTLLKAIGGGVRPAPGARIVMNGRDLASVKPHDIVEAGIALVPEGRGIFGDLTVRENLLLGAFPRRARAGEAANLASVLALFPRLSERLDQVARTMSGGEQQMVAIGRALMSAPDSLLLDEPSLGLSPIMYKEVFQILTRVRAAGTGILLVEQNFAVAKALGDHAAVMDSGRIVHRGPMAELAADEALQQRLLGLSLAVHQ
jgi:branched-chain amino acid transport system ATP-binding protein